MSRVFIIQAIRVFLAIMGTVFLLIGLYDFFVKEAD